MKATGIVRRIDDLGRVVIPKEIRRVLRIREGDSLEIYTDKEGEIVLKKYSAIGELGRLAERCADALGQVSGHIVVITDRDQVIACHGNGSGNVVGKRISKRLEDVMERREFVHCTNPDRAVTILTDEKIGEGQQMIKPVLSEGDVIGSVIVIGKNEKTKLSEVEEKLVSTISGFLGKHIGQ